VYASKAYTLLPDMEASLQGMSRGMPFGGGGALRRSSNFDEDVEPESNSPKARRPHQAVKIQAVRCPQGHIMEARVVREMLRGLEALRSGFSSERCARCKNSITTQDARYCCEACDISYCTNCSSKFLSRPLGVESVARPLSVHSKPVKRSPAHVMPGDILCCGPDAWGIHHLILVTGPMERDPEALEFLDVGNSGEVWSCETIECNRDRVGQGGVAWFSTRTFYRRDVKNSDSSMIGSLEPGTLNIERFESPVPVKLLRHPLRTCSGGPPFDVKAFNQAVHLSKVVSRKWGLGTALKGLFNLQESLNADDYPSPHSRAELLDELTARWSSSPICSSVVIMVWQHYFKIACDGPDAATQHILRWMPLLSDKTMPSVLLKVLTKRGWVMCGNLDA